MSTHRRNTTRSTSTGNPGPHLPQNTAELPAAVRRLQTQPGFHHKVSSCKKVVISKSSVRKKVLVAVKKPNITTEEQTEKKETSTGNDFFRFLGETEGMRLLIAEAAVCANCRKRKLSVSFESVGIATDIHTSEETIQPMLKNGR
jgi:hypothetical protein